MSVDATLPQDWRSIILYGRNVATYKFALGQSLLDLAREGRDRVTLEDLAIPYSRYLCEHVAEVETQTTSRSSRFLSACIHYNRGAINTTELISATVALGFNNVIDAFHTVDGHPELIRFYVDERGTRTGGLRLTDELLALAQNIGRHGPPR